MRSIFELEFFLENEIFSRAHELDSNSGLLDDKIRFLLEGLRQTRRPAPSKDQPLLISNAELQKMFCASAALGFKIAQHFSVVETLTRFPEWQEKNPALWEQIATARHLIGLATTQLARVGELKLHGSKKESGYEVSGVIPWTTGLGLYPSLMIGFETETEIVFAVIDFPSLEPRASGPCKVTPHFLKAFNSTASVSIEFSKAMIDPGQIVSCKEKGAIRSQRSSQYKFPEIGIARRALLTCRQIVEKSGNPRHQFVKERLEKFEARYRWIDERQYQELSGADHLDLFVEKDGFIHDAVRLLTLTQGATALSEKSVASRLQMEMMLYDVILQPPPSLQEKIERLIQRQDRANA